MAKPDENEVQGAVAALDYLRRTGQLMAYPVVIDGCRVTVLGQVLPAASGDSSLRDTKPVMVIVTNELAAKMDLTEVRS